MLITMAEKTPQSFSETIEIIINGLNHIMAMIQPYAGRVLSMALSVAKADALIKSGWLPHRVIPRNLLINAGEDGLAERIEAFFTAHNDQFVQMLKSDMNVYLIDEVAKDCMLQAISLHERGYYRAVCRLVFPELERVGRAEFEGNPLAPAVQLKTMLEQANQMPLKYHMDRRNQGAVLILTVFLEHLYKKVSNVEDILSMKNNGIPNRHACIHGFVDYQSMQNSINVLILFDFAFSLITKTKSYHGANHKVFPST